MSEKEPVSATPGKKPERPKARPTKPLPTERIQFSRQLDLLRAYAAASGPTAKAVTNKDVADLVKMVESTVSISNAFFTDAGLVLRTPAGFLPSQDVLNYRLAFNWNPETSAYKLAPVLRATWFGQFLVKRLSYQPLNEAEAIQALGQEVAASKDYRKQVAMLLDYLGAAGIVTRENGMVSLGPNAADGQDEVPKTPATQEVSSAPVATRATVLPVSVAPTIGAVQFHVSVKVDMSEFKGWDQARLTAFFNGIAQVLAAKGRIEGDGSSP